MSELTTLINGFLDTAAASVDNVVVPSSAEELQHLADAITLLSRQAIVIGDKAESLIGEKRTEIDQEDQIAWPLLFQWMDDLKFYVVLWRDTLFQYQKGLILLQDNKVVADDIGELHLASVEHLRKATASISESRPDVTLNKEVLDKVDDWKLLANPWTTYKEQFEILKGQATSIIEDYKRLSAVVATSTGLSEVAVAQSDNLRSEIEKISKIIDETKTYITDNQDDPKKISSHLEALEQEIETNQSLESYQGALDERLLTINEEIRVPISVEGGPISYQEINFGKQIRQWLDTEIQPSVHDMADLTDKVSNSLKMALINIRNRAIILSKEGQPQVDNQKTDLFQPLEQITDRLKQWEADLALLDEVLKSRMVHSLAVSNIYKGEEEFLPVPLQTTLTQFRLDQNELWVKLKRWVDRQAVKLSRVKDIVIREEALSDADKIVRYVRSRTNQEDRHQYDSIFKAQGYIGESFCVGRTYEKEEVEASIKAWEDGYRGSAIVTGWRHGGKTLFGEWIAQQHFPNNTIHVRPEQVLSVNDRKMTTSYDLEEALEFVKKHSLNKRYFVWIDDIERWENAEISIGKNLSALKKYMDYLSNRLYFMVSMSQWAFCHWDKLYGIKDSFQTTIKLRDVSDSEVREAILIRHGATHKRLVDEDEKDVNSLQFGKMVRQAHRLSQGIIGDTLLLWANGTKIGDGDMVYFEELPSFALPDFLDPDISVLLRYMLLRRTTSEYELRKSFGLAFKQKYSAILQRLISMGVLERRLDERLEITDGVANDIARLLEEHGYITITKQL